ncbi:MFS transporter [Luteococcus sediminum]
MDSNRTVAEAAKETESLPINVGAIVGFLVLVEFCSGLVQGFYLPLFNRVAEHLAVSDANIIWFNSVQTLSAAICVPVLSKLGDIFGHRRMLRIALLSVLLGTLITALAPSFALVLVGRVLVGPLAVWLPLEIGIVHARLPGEHGRRGIGLLVSALTLGGVIGSLVGGMTGALPIETVLLLPPLAVLVSTIAAFTVIPPGSAPTGASIDWGGFVLLAGCMATLLLGLRGAQAHGFGHTSSLAWLLAAAVLLAVFIPWELRQHEPAVNLPLVASRELWPIYVTTFLLGASLFGTQTVVTTFVGAEPAQTGYGFGLPPSRISWISATLLGSCAVAAAVFPAIARRIGMRSTMVLGVVLAALANASLALGAWSLLVLVFAAQLVCGLGSGLLLGAIPAMIAEFAPSSETGIATGIYNTLKTLGGSVAGAVFAVVLTSFTPAGSHIATLGGYRSIWWICAAGFLVGLVLLVLVRPRRGPANH